MKRILLIRFGSIGDVVLTTPAIRAVRKALPDAYIAMLVGDRCADVISASPHLDEVISFDRKGNVFSETRRAAAMIKERNFEVSIDMQRKFRSSLLAYLSGAKLRVGYHHPGGFLSTVRMPPVRDVHTVDQNLALLNPLDIESADREPEMFFSQADRNYAADIFQLFGLISKSPVIGFFPGASWHAKCWPPERFAAIGDMSVRDFGAGIAVISGPGEEDIADSVAQNMRTSAALIRENMNLRQLAATIRRCDLFLSNDTGPMHISAAVGTPTIGLFGPGDYNRFHLIGEKHASIKGDALCSPCKRSAGCRDNICMKSIPVDIVWDIVKERLSSVQSSL